MNTRVRVVATAVVVVVLGALVGAVAEGPALLRAPEPATDDAFVVDAFTREIRVERDGTLDVLETIDVTFREPRRGIIRDLSHQGIVDRVEYEIFSVDRGDEADPWVWELEAVSSSTTGVRIGEEDVVLDPGPQRYRLRYLLSGLPFRPEARPDQVQLRIDVPGTQWPTTVAASTLDVRLPGEATDVRCVVGRRGDVVSCPAAEVQGDRVVQTLPALAAHHSATVAIEVAADAFWGPFETSPAQAVDAPATEPAPPLPPVPAALLLLVLVAAPALLLEALRARFVYRDRVTDPALHDRVTPSAELAPPDGARPLDLAAVLQRSVNDELLLATVLDLELRGVLTTEAAEADDGHRVVISRGATAPTRDWERQFVTALLGAEGTVTFTGSYDAETATRAGDAKQVMQRHVAALLGFDSDLTHTGARALRGGAYVAWITLAILAGAAIGVTLVRPLGVSLFALPVIWAGLAVTWTLLSWLWRPHRLPLSSLGRDVLNRAQAFRDFLGEVHADRLEFAATQVRYDQHHPAVALLPYAMAFGQADSWYFRFDALLRQLAQQDPSAADARTAWWYHRAGYTALSRSYGSTTTAPSSGGGSSGFGGGGGGVGSGGGGGGGRSW